MSLQLGPVRTLTGYSLALAFTLVTILARWRLDPSFQYGPALLIFVFPILLSAYVGGVGPGVLATITISVASMYLFLPPVRGFGIEAPEDFLQWGLLAVLGFLISFLTQALHASVHRARQAERDRAELLVRQREEAVRQSEAARFRRFADVAPLGITCGTADGQISYANDEYLRIIGVTREEFEQGTRRWDAVTPPEWLEEDYRQIDMLQTQKTVRYEKEYFRPDGMRVPVLLGLVAHENGLGCFVLDLTREKQAERELRKSEEKFRTLAENARAVFGIVQGTRFVYANRYLPEASGYSMEEILSMDCTQLVHPDHRQMIQERALRRQRGENVPSHYEFMMLTKSGETKYIDFSAGTMDYNGRPAVIGTGFDVTERKRVEQALRESEERFRLAVDSANLIAWDYHPASGRFTWTNPEPAWGSEPQTTVHFSEFRDSIHPDDREGFEQAVRAAKNPAGSGQYAAEYRFLRADGQYRWISARGRAFFRETEGRRKAYRFLGISVDTTEQKQAQEALAQAKQAAERARAVAEEASQAKDRFLAVLSHELRTPLTPVLASVSMLQRDARWDARTRDDLEMIRRNAELEARLIDDLLDLTRIARGKIELDLQPIDLGGVIGRAVEVCRGDMDARGMHFVLDLGPAPYIVEADASRLQQVFWNLLQNAIKFTPHGGCIQVCCQPDENDRVIARVIDSGVGLEDADLERIFDAFAQVEPAKVRQFGGLGLGLAISKSLVELHGGSIHAFSEGKGKGSTFEVWLPLLVPARADAAVPSWVPMIVSAGTPAAGALRILVVEDHGDTAAMIQRMLELEGHAVETGGDVASGVQAAMRGEYDLLISDLGLPDGSGFDLLRQIREQGSEMPAIALSGYGQEQDIQESRSAGFVAHVVKPVDMDRLMSAVERAATTKAKA